VLLGTALGLEGHPLDADQPLRDLGMDSLMMAELATRIRRELGVRVAALGPDTTLADLVRSLLADLPAAPALPARSLVELTRCEGGWPFFCVHAVGGDVRCYDALARELARPLCAFQAIGYDGEGPPLGSVSAMAEVYVRELRQRQPSGPYLLGGWSFGGVIAFEMAQLLVAAGEVVARLVLIDSYAPLASNPDELARTDVLRAVAHDLGQIMQVDFPFPERELEAMPAERRLEHLLERAGALEVMTGGSGGAVFRSNLRALYQYGPRPYAGDAHVLHASRPAAVLAKNASTSWRDFVTGELHLETVPGDHYELMREPRELAVRIQSLLDAASSAMA
jgi:thioesterase domain-containing protein